jgi:hypothetical protein
VDAKDTVDLAYEPLDMGIKVDLRVDRGGLPKNQVTQAVRERFRAARACFCGGGL